MSSMTRKHRRKVVMQCAKDGIKPAKLVADSASREINAIKTATTEVMETLLQAIGVVIMHDWGKLAKKETRAEVLAKCLYERSIQAKKHTFSAGELSSCNDFSLAVMEVWEREEAMQDGK